MLFFPSTPPPCLGGLPLFRGTWFEVGYLSVFCKFHIAFFHLFGLSLNLGNEVLFFRFHSKLYVPVFFA